MARRLLEEGHQIIFLTSPKNNQCAEERIKKALAFINPCYHDFQPHFKVISSNVIEPNLGLSTKDICTLKSQGIDEVWHTAGSVSFSYSRREGTYDTNVRGNKRILDLLCLLQPKAFHYISTAFVCGNLNGSEIYREDELEVNQLFHNPYEETKFLAEKSVQKWAQDNTNTRVFIYRPSIIVGDSRTGKTSSFAGYYTCGRTFYLVRKQHSNYVGENPTPLILKNESKSVELPIFVPGVADGKLNIITIDWAVDLIIKLRNKGIPDAYHIAADHPGTYGYWLDESTKILGITGVKIGNRSNKKRNRLSKLIFRLEKQIAFGIHDYIPYISGHPCFDTRNVRKALKANFSEHPIITNDLVNTLLQYAIKQNFKNVKH